MTCVYCNKTHGTYYANGWHYPSKELIQYRETDEEPTIDVLIMNGKYLYSASERDHLRYAADAYVEINYCPMCGRKLGDDHE